MLESLLNLVKEHAGGAIVENPAIPNQHNDEAIETVTQSIMSGMQNEAAQGNMGGLMGMLAGKGGDLMNNPIVGGIAQNAIGSLMGKFGLSNGAAGNIVSQILPAVLGSMANKVSDPNDSSMDFNSVLGGLLSGNQQQAQQNQGGGFDFNQIGYALADGKLDMNDLMRVGGSMLGGSGGGNSGGLGSLLGGLFGGR